MESISILINALWLILSVKSLRTILLHDTGHLQHNFIVQCRTGEPLSGGDDMVGWAPSGHWLGGGMSLQAMTATWLRSCSRQKLRGSLNRGRRVVANLHRHPTYIRIRPRSCLLSEAKTESPPNRPCP